MSIIQSSFSPPGWLSNPHLQTIIASQCLKPAPVESDHERLELPDGDFLDINLGRHPGELVAIFHGLAGSVNSSYIRGVFQTLQQAGFRPALMHWRGCSGEPNRLKRAYHSGASDDIDWFVNYLSQRFPNTRLYGLGYSLGANALLKYLGESGSHSPLSGAMAVSPPLVLQEGANKLNRGTARLYQRHLLRLMRRQHEYKRILYPDLGLPVASDALDSLWKFDDAITAPLHGFKDANDYYQRCSARQFLPAIDIPTHILGASDDPFFTPAILPEADELSNNTTMELSSKGGHVGFLDGRKRWLDSHVAGVLDSFRQSGN
ncbi:hydrolase [Granulosicoccus antarcticus]|nr:hydrolase [Granulosicoccus antarcticus]